MEKICKLKKIREKDAFSTQEVATILGVTRRTVNNYIISGKLLGKKFGNTYVITRKNLVAAKKYLKHRFL